MGSPSVILRITVLRLVFCSPDPVISYTFFLLTPVNLQRLHLGRTEPSWRQCRASADLAGSRACDESLQLLDNVL